MTNKDPQAHIWDYVISVIEDQPDYVEIRNSLLVDQTIQHSQEEILKMSENVTKFSDMILLGMIKAHQNLTKDKLVESAKIVKNRAVVHEMNSEVSFYATASNSVRGKFNRYFG